MCSRSSLSRRILFCVVICACVALTQRASAEPGLALVPLDGERLVVVWSDAEGGAFLRALDASTSRWVSLAEPIEGVDASDLWVERGADRVAALTLDDRAALHLITGASEPEHRAAPRVLAGLAAEPDWIAAGAYGERLFATFSRPGAQTLSLLALEPDGTLGLESELWRFSGALRALSPMTPCGDALLQAWLDARQLSLARLDLDGTPRGVEVSPAPPVETARIHTLCVAQRDSAVVALGDAGRSHLLLPEEGGAWRSLEHPGRALAAQVMGDQILLLSADEDGLWARLIDPRGEHSQSAERVGVAAFEATCALHADALACVALDANGPRILPISRPVGEPVEAISLRHAFDAKRASGEPELIACGSRDWRPFEDALAAFCDAGDVEDCALAREAFQSCSGAPPITGARREPVLYLMASDSDWIEIGFRRAQRQPWRVTHLQEVGDIACGGEGWGAFRDAVSRHCDGEDARGCPEIRDAFETCVDGFGSELFPIERSDALLAESLFYYAGPFELRFVRDGRRWELERLRVDGAEE